MTAKPERLIACSYEDESSWAEDTDTWATRLQLVGQPTVTLNQERVAEPITQQYREEGKAGVLGPRTGEITLTLALTGHGGTSAGALTRTDVGTLLHSFIGECETDDQGRTVSSATSASQFAPSGIFVDGGLVRVGSLGDGRGDGQFAAVNNGTTMTLLTALGATPNVADVIYANQLLYPHETPAGVAITSHRMLIQTANKQYKLRGVFPRSLSISGTNPGEQLSVSLTYGISWWDYANETFPNTTATDAKAGTIVGNGSAFIQDVGTVTRATYSMRSFSLNFDMNVSELEGPDAVNPYQTIVGAVRNRCAVTCTTVHDAEATGTETFGDKFDAGTLQHILVGFSVVDGKAVGIYLPNAELTSRPTQEGIDGLNRVTCNWRALTSTDTTSGRTLSSFRIGMG